MTARRQVGCFVLRSMMWLGQGQEVRNLPLRTPSFVQRVIVGGTENVGYPAVLVLLPIKAYTLEVVI